jgi:penicillin-binding protein 2
VRHIQDSQTNALTSIDAEPVGSITLHAGNLDMVRDAMVDVTRPGGTAAAAGAGASYKFAGKTGTAQVVAMKQNEKYDERRVHERLRDHALFIAYAPADSPQIALAVLVENGGHGGSAAAPIARQVFDYYLLGKTPEIKPTDEEDATEND